MREIKFRAWCEIPGTDRRFYYLFKVGETVPPQYSVLSWEQYTGLKDKNGTEIYEGDIVRVLYTDWPSKSDGDSRTLEQYKKDISNNGVIEKYKHGYFVNFGLDRFGEVCRGMIDPGKHGEIEIIGDIHKNSGLL